MASDAVLVYFFVASVLTVVTWATSFAYLATLWHAASLPETHVDAIVRSEVGRDLVSAAIMAACVVVMYRVAQKDFDPQGIDIASLGIPFLISAGLLSITTYRRAKAKKLRRPYVSLLACLFCFAVLTAMVLGLGLVMRKPMGLLCSIWIQTLVGTTSLLFFMLISIVGVGVKHGLKTVKSDFFAAVLGIPKK